MGTHVVRNLLDQGYEVVAVSSQDPQYLKSRWLEGVPAGRTQEVEQRLQLLDADEVLSQKWPGGNVSVVHCAFPRNASGKGLAQWFDFHRKFCQKAAEEQVETFINVSSQSVYAPDRTSPAEETDLVSCQDRYATAKYSGEVIAQAILAEDVLVNARVASLIGPEYPERVLNRFIERALVGETLEVDSPKRIFDFMDVRDAAAGLAAILKRNRDTDVPVVNVGGSQPMFLVDIAKAVAETTANNMGVQPVSVGVRDDGLDSDQTVLSSALKVQVLRETFSFEPAHTLLSTIEWILRERD